MDDKGDQFMEHERQTYHDRIVTDPAILVGKPTVRGTRISVELVLAHLAENPDLADLFAAYPRLTVEDVKACLAYAERVVTDKGQRLKRRTLRGSVPHPQV
jgi:uncharacterized protein (DUF433 family)